MWRCLVPGLLRELESDRVVVAVDPGKIAHRVWLADRERGLIGDPVTVANSRTGIEQLVRGPSASRQLDERGRRIRRSMCDGGGTHDAPAGGLELWVDAPSPSLALAFHAGLRLLSAKGLRSACEMVP